MYKRLHSLSYFVVLILSVENFRIGLSFYVCTVLVLLIYNETLIDELYGFCTEITTLYCLCVTAFLHVVNEAISKF